MSDLDPLVQRKRAANAFNETWQFLEKSNRTPEDDRRMVELAHASRDNWGLVGQPVHWARGEWQLSRVYAEIGDSEHAIEHAKRCLHLVERNNLSDFDLAAAHEALVRAYRAANDLASARCEFAVGMATAGRVVEPEDRAVLFADLREHAAALDIPWQEH